MPKIRAPVLLAWIFCALVSVLSIVDLVLILRANSFTGNLALLVYTIVEGLLPLLFAIPGALIVSRQPRNVIGWLLITPVVVGVIVTWIDRYLVAFSSPPAPSFPIFFLMLFSGASWGWIIFPLLLLPLLFPTGRPPSPRWNWVVYLAVFMILFFYFLAAFSIEYEVEGIPWRMINPIGFIDQAMWDLIMPFWGLLLAVLTVACLASVVYRFRKGSAVEREQIKWLLYGFVLFVLAYIPSIYLNADARFSGISDLGNLLFILSIAILPAAVTAAILRYKLFDIDVIIRLTLVYAVVTALLVLVYVAGIVALQAAFRALTGQASDVAVLVTTLAITVLFNPLRRQVQEVIDRRFYRQKYDAMRALAEFATAARGGSDLDALTGMLVETVGKTLQPTQVGLYMRAGKGEEQDSRKLEAHGRGGL